MSETELERAIERRKGKEKGGAAALRGSERHSGASMRRAAWRRLSGLLGCCARGRGSRRKAGTEEIRRRERKGSSAGEAAAATARGWTAGGEVAVHVASRLRQASC